MCGGGGGDGGAAAREAERQRKQNEAIARVNRLFGVYTETPKPREEDFYYTDNTGDGGRVFDKAAYDRALQAWEAENARLRAAADENAQARTQLYDRTRQDVRDYYMNDLNRQRQDTERQARFGLARRGVIGGSSELDVGDNILEQYNRGVLDIGNRADAAATRLRTADEQARLDLISRIRSGMSAGNAVQSATTTLQNNLEAARSNAMADALGQVFSDYGYYVTEQARNRGYRRGRGGTFYANPRSYYGRT